LEENPGVTSPLISLLASEAREIIEPADSDDPGRLFQSDPGHHSDLIPAGQKPDRVA